MVWDGAKGLKVRLPHPGVAEAGEPLGVQLG